jgi:hypothetical protein
MSRGETLKSAADLSLTGFQLPAAWRHAERGFGKPISEPNHDKPIGNPCGRRSLARAK